MAVIAAGYRAAAHGTAGPAATIPPHNEGS